MDGRRQRDVTDWVIAGLTLLVLIGPVGAQQQGEGKPPIGQASLRTYTPPEAKTSAPSPLPPFASARLALALPMDVPSHAFPDARFQMRSSAERPPLTLDVKTRLPAPPFWANPVFPLPECG